MESEQPGVKPRFIFHIRGDFGNPSHNDLISVVFAAKDAATTDSAKPFQDRSFFVHLFNSGDLV